jgi:hypothetical protein
MAATTTTLVRNEATSSMIVGMLKPNAKRGERRVMLMVVHDRSHAILLAQLLLLWAA